MRFLRDVSDLRLSTAGDLRGDLSALSSALLRSSVTPQTSVHLVMT